MGSVSLLQNVTVSSQPISSMDWSPDKVQKHTYIHTEYGTTLLSTPSLLSYSLHLYLSSLFPSPLLSISLIFPSPSLSLSIPFSLASFLFPSIPIPPSPLFRRVFLHAVHLIKQFVCVLSPNSTESNTYTPLSIETHTIHIQHIIYLPSHNVMYIYSKLPYNDIQYTTAFVHLVDSMASLSRVYVHVYIFSRDCTCNVM